MPRAHPSGRGRRVMSWPSKAMRAGRWADAAADQADEGGLAGAVRADDGADLAGRNGEVDTARRPSGRRSGGSALGCVEQRHGSHGAHRSRTAAERCPWGRTGPAAPAPRRRRAGRPRCSRWRTRRSGRTSAACRRTARATVPAPPSSTQSSGRIEYWIRGEGRARHSRTAAHRRPPPRPRWRRRPASASSL